MSRLFRATHVAALLLATFFLSPLAASSQASVPAKNPKAPMLHSSARLVLVDVVAQDSSGRPVKSLTSGDFELFEDGKSQAIKTFDVHSSAGSLPRVPNPSLPAGTFTNYTRVRPEAPLTVILLDSLNTPATDQIYLRQQFDKYLQNADPDAQVAVFGLNAKLIFLEGFTSNPAVLRAAIEHKLTPRNSPLLEDPSGTKTDPNKLSNELKRIVDTGEKQMEVVYNRVKQFESEQAATATRSRALDTLDALNQIARYLSPFSGRKNLIWFSGSFPLSILPDKSLTDPFAVVANMEGEYRETASLLSTAQVAVYPVDARGLMIAPASTASRSGAEFSRPKTAFSEAENSRSMSNALSDFSQSQSEEHQTMSQMANDTGGHAFYNTNGLTEAIASALEEGANYYTLSYTPSNSDWNGRYRSIRVRLSQEGTLHGVHLAYRRGYYAVPLAAAASTDPVYLSSAETGNTLQPTMSIAQVRYLQLALLHGAPTPTELIFRSRVLPASGSTEETLAAGNQPDPKAKLKPPFRRYIIDSQTLPQNLDWSKTDDAKFHARVAVVALIYTADGVLLNRAEQEYRLDVDTAGMQQLLHQGVQSHLELSGPAKGNLYLRIAVRDLTSQKLGALEVPLAEVEHLKPFAADGAK